MDLVALVLFAKITASSAAGFISEHVIELPGVTPSEVYVALTRDVSLWWDANHSFSGEARNFYMEARAGGCFCERLAGGGSVRHMEVLQAKPSEFLRLGGGLGPLQREAVNGAMDFVLEPTESGTRISYRYAVGGYLPQGLDKWADAVDQVQLGQLERLKAFLAQPRD